MNRKLCKGFLCSTIAIAFWPLERDARKTKTPNLRISLPTKRRKPRRRRRIVGYRPLHKVAGKRWRQGDGGSILIKNEKDEPER